MSKGINGMGQTKLICVGRMAAMCSSGKEIGLIKNDAVGTRSDLTAYLDPM